MKIKVCGMKYNTAEVAALAPDYLGFIFYEGSKRNYTGEVPKLPKTIQKVGVFVDAPLDFVLKKIATFQLDVVQLHGDESALYCNDLKKRTATAIKLWKVFSIRDSFNFELLTPYEPFVQAFLFDTKGKEKGGNGITFNWDVLKNYTSTKPFVLSGGIGLAEISAIKKIQTTNLPLLAVDINSKFETAPGIKNIETLATFLKKLRNNER
jgi:phosphoribosylanthranilate isomerase